MPGKRPAGKRSRNAEIPAESDCQIFPAERRRRKERMSRARILIIEDERDLADSLALNLREEGYHVTLARRGDEGYQTAMHESFDLILLDLMLPGMDGRDICRS